MVWRKEDWDPPNLVSGSFCKVMLSLSTPQAPSERGGFNEALR